MRRGILCALLIVGPASAAEDSPVTVLLSAEKGTVELDLGGKTPEEYRKLIEEGDPRTLPEQPITLKLRLTNNTKEALQVWTTGDPVRLTLELEGPGAVERTVQRAFTREFRIPKAVEIGAGKSHEIELPGLKYGFRGQEKQAFWTEPGKYTLTASLNTGIKPAPEGSKEGMNGFGVVTLKSEPMELEVTGK